VQVRVEDHGSTPGAVKRDTGHHPFGSLKCVVTSIQRVIAVEYYDGNSMRCNALATYPVYRPSQDLQAIKTNDEH